jgi:membrane dipeptidase
MRWIKRLLLLMLAIGIVGIAAFLTFAPAYVEKSRNEVAAHAPYPVSDAARTLHADLVIGDWHAVSLLWKRDLLDRGSRGQLDIPRMIEGNVAIQVFTAVTKNPAGQNYDANATDTLDSITLLAVGQMWPPRTWNSLLQRAVYQAEKLHRFANRSDGALRIIKTRADLDALLADRATGQSVVGGILGIEGAHLLEGNLANLDVLQAAGHRVIALHHFFDNELGGSLHGLAQSGLTDFGRSVVSAVEARGLILDLAHSSPQVARDVLTLTDMPVVVSHTGIYSHCRTHRNYPDVLMQEIAASGGVIGIGFWADVTCDHSPKGVASAITAAVALVGVDHVSLGSDFDGSVGTGFDASELAALTHELQNAGLSEAGIRKVMGENMIRVLRDRLAP